MSEPKFRNIGQLKEGKIGLKNISLNNLINNQKELPLINHNKEKIVISQNIENIYTLSSPQDKNRNLLKFYQAIHFKNKPLDKFPYNSYNKRFIILNIETNIIQKNDYLDNDNNNKLISINAFEIINKELTGIQFHSYFNNDNDYEDNNQKDTKNTKNNSYYYLSDYFKGRKDNNIKLLQQLLNFIGKSMIICYNALYTIRFINKILKKYNLSEIPINKCICILRVMRLKNYKSSYNKVNSFEINELFNNYNINIDENNHNKGIIIAIALSICISKMLQEEANNNINNDNENIGNEVKNTYNNYYDEADNKNCNSITNNLKLNSQSEKEIKENQILKLNNNNYMNKNSLIPKNQNIYTIIQNNKKEFDKKYKIAKSFNKYNLVFDNQINNNVFFSLNNNSFKRNNFLLNN